VTATIRTVAEVDRHDAPYVGPAMLGDQRVLVFSDRIREMPWTEALVGYPVLRPRTWQNTALLRVVDP